MRIHPGWDHIWRIHPVLLAACMIVSLEIETAFAPTFPVGCSRCANYQDLLFWPRMKLSKEHFLLTNLDGQSGGRTYAGIRDPGLHPQACNASKTEGYQVWILEDHPNCSTVSP